MQNERADQDSARYAARAHHLQKITPPGKKEPHNLTAGYRVQYPPN